MASNEKSENTYIIDTESAAEMARLIDQSRCMNEAMGDLIPQNVDLADVHTVLDVACGPGGWALDIARLHPQMQVVGIDISQVMIRFAEQRAKIQLLDNVKFQIMDARVPLAFSAGAFDLVNARFMAAFLARNQWPMVVQECARLTREGGTIALTETDIFSEGNTNSPALEELNKLCREAIYLAGLYSGTGPRVTEVLEQLLREAGCRDIQQQWHALDFSTGTAAHPVIYSNLRFALKLVQPFLLKMVKTTQEHLDALYEQGLIEMLRDDFRADTQFLTAWGIKSETAVPNS